MARDPADVVDRRRLKRRLNVWRLVAVAAVVGAVIALAGRYDDGKLPGGFTDRIARLDVSGIILDDPARDDALAETADDEAVKALIVTIDSPGGTFVGGEALYKSLRAVAEKKPVVAVMGGTATSAAYMTALGADYVVARNGTVTGSIGVIMQTADVTGLLDKLGIKPETVKSGPLKAQPNPLEPFSPAAREATQKIIQDLFAMFVDMIVERRGLDRDAVLAMADGRVFSGRQAMQGGLVDAIGAEPKARDWLAEKYQIGHDLKVDDVDVHDDDESWRRILGMAFGKALFSERLRLDGVLSLWQPAWR